MALHRSTPFLKPFLCSLSPLYLPFARRQTYCSRVHSIWHFRSHLVSSKALCVNLSVLFLCSPGHYALSFSPSLPICLYFPSGMSLITMFKRLILLKAIPGSCHILVGNFLSGYPCRLQGCAPHSLYLLPPPIRLSSSYRGPLFFPREIFPFFFFSISDMSQLPSSSSFQGLFNAALQDFENQTKTELVEHPLAKKLEACDSVDSITAILQEQVRIFGEIRGEDIKIMKSLRSSVDILYTLSNSTILGEVIGLVSTYKIFNRGCCS